MKSFSYFSLDINMGSCVSASNNVPIVHDECNHECMICNHAITTVIPLACNHSIHAECITKWWSLFPQNGLCCPLCRQKTYSCYMEITKNTTKDIIGYYRHDAEDENPIILRKNYTGDSEIIYLPTLDARDTAFTAFMLFMARNNPSLQSKIDEIMNQETPVDVIVNTDHEPSLESSLHLHDD